MGCRKLHLRDPDERAACPDGFERDRTKDDLACAAHACTDTECCKANQNDKAGGGNSLGKNKRCTRGNCAEEIDDETLAEQREKLKSKFGGGDGSIGDSNKTFKELVREHAKRKNGDGLANYLKSRLGKSKQGPRKKLSQSQQKKLQEKGMNKQKHKKMLAVLGKRTREQTEVAIRKAREEQWTPG